MPIKEKLKKERKAFAPGRFLDISDTYESRPYPQIVCYIKEGPVNISISLQTQPLSPTSQSYWREMRKANIDRSPCQVRNCGLHCLWSSNFRHLGGINYGFILHRDSLVSAFWCALFRDLSALTQGLESKSLSSLHSWFLGACPHRIQIFPPAPQNYSLDKWSGESPWATEKILQFWLL